MPTSDHLDRPPHPILPAGSRRPHPIQDADLLFLARLPAVVSRLIVATQALVDAHDSIPKTLTEAEWAFARAALIEARKLCQ